MSSAQVQRPIKVDSSKAQTVLKNRARSKENERLHRKSSSGATGYFPKKHKHENDGRSFKRKRIQSFTVGSGKIFPSHKRRKKEDMIIPPTRFLLGGNIYDPLNLSSLQDEEINRAMNAVTPKSSPIPTPRHRKGEIEVIIPPNLRDPLNLISCEDDAEYEQQLVSPTKRARKSRNRKKKRNSSSGGSCKEDIVEGCVPVGMPEVVTVLQEEKVNSLDVNVVAAAPVMNEENPTKKELNLELPIREKDRKAGKGTEDFAVSKDCKPEKKRKPDPKDKIVSPVVPQPRVWKRLSQYSHRGGGNVDRDGEGAPTDGNFGRCRPGGNWQHKRRQKPQQMPNFRKKNEYFQYGNYLRYYGYRNPQHEVDVRLKCFEGKKEIFQDKDVLDIGCNIGHITLIVARDFGAKSVLGLDIDRKLVAIARKNVRRYVKYADSPPSEPGGGGGGRRGGSGDSKFFPISSPIVYGPVDIPGISHGQSPSASKKFPHNVSFIQGNYVLDADSLLALEQPQFDVILCLSITKWLHLNWGDAGLKQAFRRMYSQLRPGGHLILEPQAWESYRKKKSLTDTIFKNYNSIQFFPWKFTEYLLSSEVGFTQCEVIATPFHQSKGFQRPIQLFTKGEISPSRSAASSTNTPSHTVGTGASRLPVYMPVNISSREVGDDDEDDDDDDDDGCERYARAYKKCSMPVEEHAAMETDSTENLEGQDCVSSRFVSGHVRENVDINSRVPVIRDSGPPDSGGVSAVVVGNDISNTGTQQQVEEGNDFEFASRGTCEQLRTAVKSEGEGTVCEDMTVHKEVVSVRVAKVHIDSEKFACDEESVKMETKPSSNET